MARILQKNASIVKCIKEGKDIYRIKRPTGRFLGGIRETLEDAEWYVENLLNENRKNYATTVRNKRPRE